MRRRRLGRSELFFPVVGQGTWLLDTFDRGEVVATLQRGFDLGLTHVDTAWEYGLGRVEAEIVGPAVKGRRHELQISSKLVPAAGLDYARAIAACDSSLARIGTDYLDLLLLHWYEDGPLEEAIRAFEDLQKMGKIRAYGFSNLDVGDLESAIALAGEGRIACDQVCYSLQLRNAEHALIPFCRAHGITLTAYSPFGDHSTPSSLFPETLMKSGGTLESIAAAHGVSPRAVALAFLLRNEVLAIPRAERIAFVEDNASAGDLVLSADEVARIEARFPLPEERRVPWCRGWE